MLDNAPPEKLKNDFHLHHGEVTCKVDEEYMEFIREAYRAHTHGMKFVYFCEAQLVWDKIMAINALNYLKVN